MYENMENIADVNTVASNWSQYYISAVEKVCDTVVSKQVRTNLYKAQWFDLECKQLRQEILCETCPFSREVLSRKYKLLKQRKKRQYKAKVILELDNNCGNSKLFWKTFKNLTSAKNKTQTNLNPTEVCKQLKQFSEIPAQEYFSEKSQQEIEQFLHLYDKGFNASHQDIGDMVNILNDNISIEEIEGAINKLKNGKSPGLDGIPSEMVKHSVNAIKSHLQALYNYILSSGVYPDCWCEGLRVAIPKNENDVRPITIEPIFGKVLETILDNRINFVNEVFEKNDKYNGGFSKGSMVQDNILTIYGCIHKQLCQGKSLFIAFVDFKKAFNFVNHKVLFYKLIKAGINGRILKLLRNMYGKLKARVKVNQCLYEWIIDKSGTNQGGPLSPNMFKYLLADLKEFLDVEYGITIDEDIMVHLLWADDLVLMSDTKEGLQKHLDGLLSFCSKFQLIVNELKTKVMIFGKYEESVTFVFNKTPLEITSQYKYLGVIFSPIVRQNGNIFKEMNNYVSGKGLRACFATTKKCSDVGYVTPKVAIGLFDSFVTPILNYASELWSKLEEDCTVERTHLKNLKYVLGVKKSTCSLAVYGELGRFPLHLSQMVKVVKFWARLETMAISNPAKQVYEMLKTFDRCGFNTWIKSVRGLLEKYNFEVYWDRPGLVASEYNAIVNEFKCTVYEKYKLEWFERLSQYPKMRTLITFKTEFKMESYLLEIKAFKLRKLLCKLRLSSHDLEIERGRYNKLAIEERICKTCNSGQVEDEKHIILHCATYNKFRTVLFSIINKEEPGCLEGSTLFKYHVNYKCKNNVFTVQVPSKGF
jgi:hypothetical protein